MVGFDDATAVAIIMAIVRVVTDPDYGLPKRYAPIIAVVLGILAGTLYMYPGDWKQGIWYGIVLGLTAVGAYSGAKNVIKGREEGDKNDQNRSG